MSTAEAFIQWKGTNVCLDWSCECGAEADRYHFHVHGMFVYALRCPDCSAVWRMPDTLQLIRDDNYDGPITSGEPDQEIWESK